MSDLMTRVKSMVGYTYSDTEENDVFMIVKVTTESPSMPRVLCENIQSKRRYYKDISISNIEAFKRVATC